MSSISNERSSDEVARRNIEEVKSREAESNKKHANEMRRLTEQFTREIEALKQEHQKQMDGMRSRANQTMTERDYSYQNQMEKLRGLFTEQMRKKSEDYQLQKNEMQEAFNADLDKKTQISEQQKQVLREQFDSALKEKDQNYAEFTQSSRQQMDTDRKDIHEKFENMRQKERNEIFKAHEEKVAGLNRNIKDIKQARDSQLKQIKSQAENDRNRIMANQSEQIENERMLNRAAIETINDSFKTEQKIAQDKYRQNIENQKIDNEETNLKFQEKISDKMNQKIASLENNLKVQKDLNVIDATNRKRIADNQMRNLVAENTLQIKNFEKDREQIINDSNQRVGSEVIKAVATKDDIIRKQNLNHGLSREQDRTAHQRQVLELTRDYDSELAHVKYQSENQLEKNQDNQKKVIESQAKFYADSVDTIKENYSNELNNERQRTMRERAELESRLTKKAKEFEIYMQKQVDYKEQVATKKLDQVKEAYEKEIKRIENENKLKAKEQEKSSRTMVENTKIKYEDQIEQMKSVHETEIERMNRKHQEEMNSLVQKMNYSNRKA